MSWCSKIWGIINTQKSDFIQCYGIKYIRYFLKREIDCISIEAFDYTFLEVFIDTVSTRNSLILYVRKLIKKF